MSQEIYVKEMPKSCFDCPIIVEGIEGYDCCVCAFLVKAAETKNRLKDCPLKSLHDHDKELVAKVLERIKSLITKYDLLKDYQNCAGYFILDKIIEQIQKEIAEL